MRRKNRRKSGKGEADAKPENKAGSFSVRWTPALVEPNRLKQMAEDIPGAILATEPDTDPRSVVRSALTGVVNAICRDAAKRIEVPAPPPQTRTASRVAAQEVQPDQTPTTGAKQPKPTKARPGIR